MNNKRIRFSRWTHRFERGDIVAFFNSISLGLVFVSKDLGTRFGECFKKPLFKTEAKTTFSGELIESLIDEGILVLEDWDDEKQFIELRKKLLRESTLELMYLLVTDRCNLRCEYCFEETPLMKKSFVPTHMTDEVAKHAIDLFARLIVQHGNPEKRKTIHLYGGEPLLNKQVIRFAVLYVRNLIERGTLPKSCQMAIVTNGVTMDDPTARFLAENGVTVGLSLDGPQWLNNFYRRPKNKNLNVFSKVMDALTLLKTHGAKIGLSVTLTPLAIEHFDKLLGFLINEIGKVDGVSLNLLHFNRKVVVAPNYYEQAARCQLQAFEKFRDLGIYEERIIRKTKAFIERRPMYGDCGAMGNQLVIAPDGQIGVCQDFVKPRTYFTGNVKLDFSMAGAPALRSL
ncbi:MAG: radical SAM protein [Bacteroidota bacterium]|nr:radical SAM protein [Bacteroidota bacterium]